MKKSVIFVNGNLSVGGVERALISLLNAIDFNEYDVDLLLLQPGDDYLDELPKQVNLIRRDITNAYGPFLATLRRSLKEGDMFSLAFRFCVQVGVWSMKPLCRSFSIKERYDVAISFRPGICEEIALNVISATKKITWWHHGNFEVGISKAKLISNWIKFDNIVTVSNGIAAKIKELSEKLTNKVTVIPNIIDIDDIRIKAEETLPYDLSPNLKIVTVSRLSKEKNLSQIIEVALALSKKEVAFEWHILGDGDMRAHLENEIKKVNLTERILIHGKKENPYPWIKYADMMVHPSTVESFGIVLLEAMALGTPCISCPSIGALDLIDGSNGLVADGGTNDLTTLIEKLSRDNTLKETIIKCGTRTIGNFLPTKVIETFYSMIGK